MDTDELKRELAKVRSSRSGRYPVQLREAVVALANRNKTLGKSHGKTAAEVGMSLQTLCYWRALSRSSGSKLARVAIVQEPAPRREVIVECGPLRVLGLDVVALAELVRRLS
jgi:hypothetical protein